ncbi:MAG: DUF3093 domain-containing protein [Nocardioidaceae bacterium]
MDQRPLYYERLSVPLRWWALATMFLASVLLAFLVATPAAVAFGTTGALTLLVGTVFLSYGAAQVEVREGHFWAGGAHIPVAFLHDPQPLDTAEARRALGVEADARAFLLVRPYLKRAVRVRVVDPADPTPYWLVNTRHPRRLAAALATAIEAAH